MKNFIISKGRVIFILFILFYVVFSGYFFITNIDPSVFEIKIIFAITCYLLSHLLRGIRLWIVISDVKVSLMNVYLLSFAGDTLGGILNKVLGEATKVYIFNSKTKNNLWKILIAILYTRFHDFLFFFFVITYLSIKNKLFDRQFSFLITVGLVIIFTIIYILPRLIDRVNRYLIKHNHSNFSTKAVKFLHQFKETFITMKINNSETIFLILFLTIGIWILEFGAIYLILFKALDVNISESLILTIENILSSVFSVVFDGGEKSKSLYNILYLSIFIFSLFPIIKSLKKEK